jgi:hypothetical protein
LRDCPHGIKGPQKRQNWLVLTPVRHQQQQQQQTRLTAVPSWKARASASLVRALKIDIGRLQGSRSSRAGT